MRLHPIGIVRSPVLEPIQEGWGQVISTLELDPALAPQAVIERVDLY